MTIYTCRLHPHNLDCGAMLPCKICGAAATRHLTCSCCGATALVPSCDHRVDRQDPAVVDLPFPGSALEGAPALCWRCACDCPWTCACGHGATTREGRCASCGAARPVADTVEQGVLF
jgi:hypothetical protein